MTYQYAPTRHSKWCDRCHEEKAQYRVTYSTDRHIAKWSTPNGERYVSDVCLDCYREIGKEEERGEIWSSSSRFM